MSFFKPAETAIEIIARTGELYGKNAYAFLLMGRRAGFTSTSVFNAIKEFDNAVADFPVLSNSTLDIISSSANDTAAGTGVRTVQVVYIDNAGALVQSAPIALNGVTLVTSVLTGVNEVLWMETVTAGSLNYAAGNIRLRINGGTVEVEQISAMANKSLSLRFMIPTGWTGYLVSWRTAAINNDQDVRLATTTLSLDRSLAPVQIFEANAYTPIDTAYSTIPLPFLKVPAGARLIARTLSAATGATVRCDVSVTLVLIQD